MKKTFQPILAIVILTLFCSCSNSKTIVSNSDSDLPIELFQRWKLEYGTANGERILGLPQSPNNDYEFKRNGEYHLFNEDGTFIIGTWEYNSAEKTVYTKRIDGEVNGKFSEIKSEGITLIPAGKAVEGTPYENFKFFYVPKK